MTPIWIIWSIFAVKDRWISLPTQFITFTIIQIPIFTITVYGAHRIDTSRKCGLGNVEWVDLAVDKRHDGIK